MTTILGGVLLDPAWSGEKGLYACEGFKKGDTVLIPRQAWYAVSSMADVGGGNLHALVQPVVMDQTGRTRLFAMSGVGIL